jgi:hypothetical protein
VNTAEFLEFHKSIVATSFLQIPFKYQSSERCIHLTKINKAEVNIIANLAAPDGNAFQNELAELLELILKISLGYI